MSNRYNKEERLKEILNYQLTCALFDGIQADIIWEIFSDAMKQSKDKVQDIKRATTIR